MLETTRFESERRLLGAGVLAAGLSAFAAMMVLIAPGILEDVDIEALLESYPPALVEALQLELIASVEGFLAFEVYWFGWLLVLGIYVAYSAAGAIAGDIEEDRMDMLLAAPVSRRRLLVEKFLSLLVPIVVVNVAVLAVVFAGTRLVGEPIAAVDLVAVHLLSVPYLLLCGAFGMLASVVAPSRRAAEGIAAGGLVAAFLAETVLGSTDLAWLRAATPMHYYDPVAILTASEYGLADAVVLLGGTAVLLALSSVLFQRRDVR